MNRRVNGCELAYVCVVQNVSKLDNVSGSSSKTEQVLRDVLHADIVIKVADNW